MPVRLPLILDNEVFWFDVAMTHAVVVAELDSIAHLPENVADQLKARRSQQQVRQSQLGRYLEGRSMSILTAS